MNNELYEWTPASMVEVTLEKPDDFLKVKETLTRIGMPSPTENTLYQTCHILHKRGKYYILSFLELFILDGKASTLSNHDVDRRNSIIRLLEDWGLLKIVDKSKIETGYPNVSFKVIPFKDKKDWELIPKYRIGNIKKANKNV